MQVVPTGFVLGFGKVGKQLVKFMLRENWGIDLVGVANSKGSVLPEGPKEKAELLRIIEEGRRLEEHSTFTPGLVAPEIVVSTMPDFAFIAIPPSYETGEPNRTIYYKIIDSGINIVTADKTLLALEYDKVMARVERTGVKIGYRATVVAGTPVLDVARALKFRGVERIRGILNSTSNFVLGIVQSGVSLSEAVKKSIEVGLAEPDPSIDLHGYDAAAKLAITANMLGYKVSLKDVKRVPLTDDVLADLVNYVQRKGGYIKQVATADFKNGELSVEPVIVEEADPLARSVGEINVVVFELEGSQIIIEGPAGPAWRTARVMLADAKHILEEALA